MSGPVSSKDPPLRGSRRRGRQVASAEILETLRRLEGRLDALEGRLSSLEKKDMTDQTCDPSDPTCSADLIGCLDDCVDDVKAIRKRVKDARTTDRRH